MQHSETFAQVAAALGRAQGQFPTIPRDRLVKVRMKPKPGQDGPGGEYTFRYAPLETILDKTRKPLADAELALVQAVMLEDDGQGHAVEIVRTTLVHSSGEWFANDTPVYTGSGDNKSQAWASGTTYARRYGVTLLLCIAADDDDDGDGGDQQQRPDQRQERVQRYEGSFPRQGGGRSNKPQPQRDREPIQEPKAAAQRAAVDQALAEVEQRFGTTLYGDDLTPGQRSLLKAAADAAGLDDSAARDLLGLEDGGVIDASTFSTAQRMLKDAVNSRG